MLVALPTAQPEPQIAALVKRTTAPAKAGRTRPCGHRGHHESGHHLWPRLEEVPSVYRPTNVQLANTSSGRSSVNPVIEMEGGHIQNCGPGSKYSRHFPAAQPPAGWWWPLWRGGQVSDLWRSTSAGWLPASWVAARQHPHDLLDRRCAHRPTYAGFAGRLRIAAQPSRVPTLLCHAPGRACLPTIVPRPPL